MDLFRIVIKDKKHIKRLLKVGLVFKDIFSKEYFTTSRIVNQLERFSTLHNISYSKEELKVITYSRKTGYILAKLNNSRVSFSENLFILDPEDFRIQHETIYYLKDMKLVTLTNIEGKVIRSFLVEFPNSNWKIQYRRHTGFEMLKTSIFKQDLEQIVKDYLKIKYTNVVKYNQGSFDRYLKTAEKVYGYKATEYMFKENTTWICKCDYKNVQEESENGFYMCKRCKNTHYVHEGNIKETYSYEVVLDLLLKGRLFYQYGKNKKIVCVKGNHIGEEIFKDIEGLKYQSGEIVKLDKDFLNSKSIIL